MAKRNNRIEVQSIDKVKTLIELLGKYKGDLPAELKASLDELADCDAIEFRRSELQAMAGDSEVETDFHTPEIVSVNPILKRVQYLDDGNTAIAFPEKFKLGAKGSVFVQWGY